MPNVFTAIPTTLSPNGTYSLKQDHHNEKKTKTENHSTFHVY